MLQWTNRKRQIERRERWNARRSCRLPVSSYVESPLPFHPSPLRPPVADQVSLERSRWAEDDPHPLLQIEHDAPLQLFQQPVPTLKLSLRRANRSWISPLWTTRTRLRYSKTRHKILKLRRWMPMRDTNSFSHLLRSPNLNLKHDHLLLFEWKVGQLLPRQSRHKVPVDPVPELLHHRSFPWQST